MKKISMLLWIVSFLPATILAVGEPEQCALNSTCSFAIRGKFNKEFMTSDLQAGKTYVCRVIRGSGRLLSIKNIYASKEVTYELKGVRFNQPFVIHGPQRGAGFIQYTIYNNNDPWNTDNIQFKCE